MSSDIKIQAPIKIDLKIIVVDDEGNSGEITYELPSMQYPTKESIDDAIKEVSKSDVAIKNNMRPANKRETFDYMIRERTGSSINLAMPGHDTEWTE